MLEFEYIRVLMLHYHKTQWGKILSFSGSFQVMWWSIAGFWEVGCLTVYLPPSHPRAFFCFFFRCLNQFYGNLNNLLSFPLDFMKLNPPTPPQSNDPKSGTHKETNSLGRKWSKLKLWSPEKKNKIIHFLFLFSLTKK